MKELKLFLMRLTISAAFTAIFAILNKWSLDEWGSVVLATLILMYVFWAIWEQVMAWNETA